MILATHISKKFKENQILKNVSLKIENQKMNMLIGTSGCGKTVLLKILLGLYTPSAGEVWYDDMSFFTLNEKDKKELRSKIGMVFQGAALFDSLNVLENVMMPLNFHTKQKYDIKVKKVKEALERVNLENAIFKKPNELSGGMKKRVAIARAIILNPTYFFCDEPNSGLDPQTSILIDDLIQDLTIEKKMTTIIVSHDMNTIFTKGDNIYFLSNGSIEWNGNKDEILTAQNLPLQNFVFAAKKYFLKISNPT